MTVQNKGIPFGRAMARELTAEEMEMIGGGDEGSSFMLTRCIRSIEYDCGDYMQID